MGERLWTMDYFVIFVRNDYGFRMLRQKLQQKLLQKLSPQQIQMIKLLEVPTLQIEQRIKKELEENPALEEGTEEDTGPEEEGDDEEFENDDKDKDKDKDKEEFTLDDYMEDDDIPDYRLQVNNYSKDDENRSDIPFSGGSSFQEYVESQFGLRDLTEKQK